MNTTRAACFSAACFILMGFLLTVTGPAHAEEDLLFTHIPLVGSEQDCKLAGGCGKDFSLSLADIDKDFILVELFSMYCPICQGAAGNVNKLHELIEKSPFASRMLMLGAGADNSALRSRFFQEKILRTFWPVFRSRIGGVRSQQGQWNALFSAVAKSGSRKAETALQPQR